METKIIRRIGAAVVAVLWLTVTAFAWFSKPKEISQSERRPLAQMPEISLQAVFSGKYMEVFEDGALDQFPARDQFRQFKSIFHYYGLKQTDNNGVYLQQGHAAKLLYPMNDKAVEQATTRLGQVYEKYLKDTGSKIYMAIIPDKSYYLAQEGEILAMDYDALFQTVERELPWATYIDLTQALQIEDYYTTDIHWRQENLFEVAQTLAQAMDVSAPKAEEYIKKPVDRPFYGVYYGQAALPLPADTMYLMEHEQIAACTVYDHETGKTTSVYDLEKQDSKDLYDVFLSGSKSLLTIENPNAKTDKELIVFRDSFASSLIPLLLEDYQTVTLVDIRYMSTEVLGRFIDFHGQDVLMLYCTTVLNSEGILR